MTFRDCPTSFGSFVKQDSFRSPTTSADIFEAKWIATIYHGLPSSLFRASYGQGSYLAFLGRLTAEKGPEDAIRIAEAVGMPLRIAAKIPRAETAYFKKQLQPHIDAKG